MADAVRSYGTPQTRAWAASIAAEESPLTRSPLTCEMPKVPNTRTDEIVKRLRE